MTSGRADDCPAALRGGKSGLPPSMSFQRRQSWWWVTPTGSNPTESVPHRGIPTYINIFNVPGPQRQYYSALRAGER